MSLEYPALVDAQAALQEEHSSTLPGLPEAVEADTREIALCQALP